MVTLEFTIIMIIIFWCVPAFGKFFLWWLFCYDVYGLKHLQKANAQEAARGCGNRKF